MGTLMELDPGDEIHPATRAVVRRARVGAKSLHPIWRGLDREGSQPCVASASRPDPDPARTRLRRRAQGMGPLARRVNDIVPARG